MKSVFYIHFIKGMIVYLLLFFKRMLTREGEKERIIIFFFLNHSIPKFSNKLNIL